MRHLRFILFLPFLGACGGSTVEPSGIQSFLAERQAALESSDLARIAATYTDDYLNQCETKPDALARWTRTLAANPKVAYRVVYSEYVPHLGRAYAEAVWTITGEKEQTVVRGKHLLRLDSGTWKESGDQWCQTR